MNKTAIIVAMLFVVAQSAFAALSFPEGDFTCTTSTGTGQNEKKTFSIQKGVNDLPIIHVKFDVECAAGIVGCTEIHNEFFGSGLVLKEGLNTTVMVAGTQSRTMFDDQMRPFCKK